VGSIVFLFPLFWLVSTSLKPIEQTMQLPAQWLPRACYAQIDGERVKVVKKNENQIVTTETIVRVEEGIRPGEKTRVQAAEYRDGKARVEERYADETRKVWRRASLIKQVPVGWYYVTEKFDRQAPDRPPRWDCLPASQIEERIEPQWFNYRVVLDPRFAAERNYVPFLFWRYLRNTLVICILGMIGTVVSCSLVAYGLARIPWRGSNLLLVLTLATMMVPFPATMVPLYALYRKIGTALDWPWIGTLKPLWVPYWFGSAFNIFLLRQFFKTIPGELSDAARIDGCSEWRIFWNIILPLSKPALAVVALFHFMYAWNDFMGPLIYLTDKKDFTLSLALQFFQSQQGGNEWHFLMAAATLMVVPIVVLFFFTQRTFIQGIATTGGKG
jgi:multiple sugar transport system permease protein